MLSESIVYIVDDDSSVLHDVTQLLTSVGLQVKKYTRALEFLKSYDPDHPGVLLTALRMPVMSGLELQKQIMENGWEISVVFISGYGDVSTVVRAMKAGAVDFIEKPYDRQDLIERIQRAMNLGVEKYKQNITYSQVVTRLKRLTRRERQVFEDVVAGYSNKQIATRLQISEKTVEAHRARVMEKVEANNLVELVKMAVIVEQYRDSYNSIVWKNLHSVA